MRQARAVTAKVRRINSATSDALADDLLAVEEPLEIRIGMAKGGKSNHQAISITMRTPGADLELAAGFLFTEGILNDPSQISSIRHCGLPAKDKNIQNTVVVELNEGVDVDLKRL